ncbi:hypothetical protein BGZ99_008634 [Dissophora globulifera]|uniref:W2 domain-containing protein n=1 Tax=Dissophora globulifera TaxID=979702 RepID=A0A9P6UYZ5_9FUNG|nr:hypothetical protein BGZ99_008634 [Dissophora globulifera]
MVMVANQYLFINLLCRSRSTDAVDDPLSRIGTSVDSVDNVAFDGDDMDLNHSTDSIDATDSDSSMADAEASVRPLAAHLLLRSEGGKLERKSRLKRKIDRLRAKNATLKSTVTQIKSDLALERQKRSTMDQIYLSIKKDLNLKLEAEETKVLSLKAEIEQMAAEMKDMKERLASTSVSVEADDKASSRYKIEYDSSTYSLSNGITSIGGLIMSCHANLDLIDGQDDSEEFLRGTHLLPSSALQGSSKSLSDSTFATMSSDDDDMDDEDQSDDDDGSGDVVSALFSQTPSLVTSASSQRGSVTSPSSLPGLVEEESEDMEESDEDPTDDSTPRTMMEIILQRQRTRSPEDDVKDPPADANETFETMAQKALFHAIRSKFTVAQAHLQLEELIVKYDARLEQAVDVIAKEVSQWWEDERVATGGPISGGWGVEDVVIDRETGEQGSPKTALERRVNSFFGPLLLQFVASLREQKMLLEKLETYAKANTRWMKNHNAVLVALYKFDVVESEAVLEWWQGLTEPQGVFGHGGDNLRSLSAKFVAWLEDEEDDSDSEDDDEDSDADSSCVDDDDSDDDLEDADEDVMEQDEETMLETILDLAFPAEDNTNSSSNVGKDKDMPQESLLAESKRKISFCTNNMYYSQDGKAFCREDATAAGDLDTDEGAVKKHV